MFKRKAVNVAALLALGTLVSGFAAAQEGQKLERVEVTGSSIKRIAGEGAVPIITLTKTDIERSGATSAADLLQNLPSMQGFTYASDSVNGGGGGATTAALRGISARYTLVLLNGRRIAPLTSGSVVNLELLPLSMVQRVEVLTDGASAIYGSDAIAGVVNFITATDSTEGNIDLKFSLPERAGGSGAKLSLSKGFGNLATDGFNLLAGISVEYQEKITAQQREWTKAGGNIRFSNGGKNYLFQSLSSNSNPPNASASTFKVDGTGAPILNADGTRQTVSANWNPYLTLNKNCGPSIGSIQTSATRCNFNFAATVDAQPEADRKNLFIAGRVNLGKDWVGFTELMMTDASIVSAYAPPAQPFSITSASPLWAKYVVPTLPSALTAPGLAPVTRTTLRLRLEDAGRRTDDYRTTGTHFVAGASGLLAGWDVNTSFVHSFNSQLDLPRGGYSSFDTFTSLIAAGKFDPFAQGTAANAAGIAPAVLTNNLSTVRSQLDTLKVSASNAIFKAPGGDAYLGAGLETSRQLYQIDPSLILQSGNALLPATFTDFVIGGGSGSVPTKASRDVKSAYTELVIPLAKTLEVTGAARYDSYSAVKNSVRYDINSGLPVASGDDGKAASKATYKLALRFQPMPELLLRGSIGTGFAAPTINEISTPITDAGVVSGFKPCPVPTGDPNRLGCRSFPYEYRAIAGGNPSSGSSALRPETTKQATIGFRYEPTSAVTVGMDFWSLKIKNAITAVDQDAAFANYAAYKGLFSVTKEPGTGDDVLTLLQSSINAATKNVSGVDWDLAWRGQTSIGTVTARYEGTYMLKSDYDFGFGAGKESSLGRFGTDGTAVFRVQGAFSVTLANGNFSNTLMMRHHSGYTDTDSQSTADSLQLVNADGTLSAVSSWPGLKIPAQYLVDWQGRYAFAKNFSITLGFKNLFDKKPPLALKNTGSNMLGVDPRYSDTIGRSVYVSANHKF